jgi:tripartite-type tricarboxylate transporter receptor subunit TctC
MEISLWYGIAAPARTPSAIVSRLNSELNKILDMPDIRRSFAQQGAEAAGGTPERFERFMREESDRWRVVVKQAGIKPE